MVEDGTIVKGVYRPDTWVKGDAGGFLIQEERGMEALTGSK
jgi:hypothetical protein